MNSPVFVHTALFKAEKGGWNELRIKITLNDEKQYTIRFTQDGPDYEKVEISNIDNIIYFPSSLIKMISGTGQHMFSNPAQLCTFITKICTTTLEEDKNVINKTIISRIQKYCEKIAILENHLGDALLQIAELRYELELANKRNDVLDRWNE